MDTTKNPVIAIVGAGPAGLTAAVILHRGGHPVRVYEAELSTDQRAQGGTLDLHQDQGQVALERAGLLAAFRAIARHEDQDQRSVDPFSGEQLAGAFFPDEEMDRPEIDRGALRQLLLDALPAGTVQWGCKLLSIAPGTAGAHALLFSNGVRLEADVVIGADGAWSRVRPFLGAERPLYTGITFYEGWIDHPSPELAELVGRGSLFAFGGTEAVFAQRNGQGRLCVYAALKRPAGWVPEDLSQHETNWLIQACYDQWASNMRGLLAACGDLTARPIYTLQPDFAWQPQAGLILIGDAAHLMPPVGVGVNLAMLDAADVASALCSGDHWRIALRQAEIDLCKRAGALMPDAIAGFQQWFDPLDGMTEPR